jgi:hypothetical protein
MQNQTQFSKTLAELHGQQIAVEQRRGEPGGWTVEAIDIGGDGNIYQAVFYGPGAEKRAHEYARFKYGSDY